MTDLKLDIMRDNWIPVIMIDGAKKEISLFEAITDAQNIKELQPFGIVNIEEYILYAFIFDFVQWVYKPTGFDEEDKKEAVETIFKKGHFDKQQLSSYIEQYEKSGKSFDLFDDDYPFMQMNKKEWDLFESRAKKDREKANETSLASPKFGVGRLAGNNSIFRHNRLSSVNYEEYSKRVGNHALVPGTDIYSSKVKIEDCVHLTPVEFFVGVLYCIGYKHSSGRGGYTPPSMSWKKHPIFVTIVGNNLFETICASIGVSSSYNGRPIWERDSYFMTGSDLINSSMDNNVGLTYAPTIRIYHKDYEKIWEKPFAKSLYQTNDNSELNLPIKSAEKWAKAYPRILRTKNSKTEEFMPAMYFHENLSADNPILRMGLLQLQSTLGDCDILDINYEVLKKKTNLKIRYYALAFINAKNKDGEKQYGKTFECEKKYSKRVIKRLRKSIPFISQIAKITAKNLSNADIKARTRGKVQKSKKLSYCSISETEQAIDKCIYELEHNKFECLEKEETEDYLNLFDWIAEEFLNTFERHRCKLPRHSLLQFAETSNSYYKEISKVKKKAKEREVS